MHVCHGPVKIILYKYAMRVRKTLFLQGRRVHRVTSLETLHKQGFTSLSSSWGITMNQKKLMSLSCGLPHSLRQRTVAHRNFIFISPSSHPVYFPIFKYLHKPRQLQ